MSEIIFYVLKYSYKANLAKYVCYCVNSYKDNDKHIIFLTALLSSMLIAKLVLAKG